MKAGASMVVLTGAGISAESGMETFRDPEGIWARHRLEDVATPEAFRRDPAFVLDFYNMRRRGLLSPQVAPNAAHRALAELESRRPETMLLVTQNIDDLHERAGSRNIIHMHGELLKIRCTRTGRVDSWLEDLSPGSRCACCGERGTLRPHVVWFGEIPFEMDRIEQALRLCDVFVSIGTSGSVYPAAGFVEIARAGRRRVRAIELNLQSTAISSLFDERRYGPATRIVPSWVSEVLTAPRT